MLPVMTMMMTMAMMIKRINCVTYVLILQCDKEPESGNIATRNSIDVKKTPIHTCMQQLLHFACVVLVDDARRENGEMYSGHARLSVYLSAAACPHYCTDPDVTWGNIGGAP